LNAPFAQYFVQLHGSAGVVEAQGKENTKRKRCRCTAASRLAAALRHAQREMSQDPRWASPYFWAAFVLQGDWP
jgi:hypothetical protein